MAETRPTSFRLTEDTLDKLRQLRQPHEPMAQTLTRAIAALEDAQTPTEATPTGGGVTALLSRMDALAARIAALEGTRAAMSAIADNVSPHSRPDYPEEARRLAVQLSREGKPMVEIRATMLALFGRAPDLKNIGRLVNGWRGKLGE